MRASALVVHQSNTVVGPNNSGETTVTLYYTIVDGPLESAGIDTNLCLGKA
jgi:hypothetical protein